MSDAGHDDHFDTLDDFDVEISDLPVEETGHADTGERRNRPGRRIYNTHAPLRLHFTPRQRALQFAATASILVLSLIALLGDSAAVRNTLTLRLFGPTPSPTPTLAPGLNLFYVNATPAWGHLAVDGHMLSYVPTAISGDSPIPMSRGRHQLVWAADPFQPQSCFVSVPPAILTDTCLVNNRATSPLGVEAWVVNFSESLHTLPTDQHNALVNMAQALLDTQRSTTTVQPGEQYVNLQAPLDTATALSPLRATQHFSLDANSETNKPCAAVGNVEACTFQGQDCRSFCEAQPAVPVAPQAVWDVFAIIDAKWDYTALDGKVVARDQPDTQRGNDANEEYRIELYITWDGARWQVTFPTPNNASDNSLVVITNPACASSLNDIDLNTFYSQTGGREGIPLSWSFVSGTNGAAGCLAVGKPQYNFSLTPNASPLSAAYLMHRFGLVLAANAAAQTYFGAKTSVADAYVRNLAQHLAALSS